MYSDDINVFINDWLMNKVYEKRMLRKGSPIKPRVSARYSKYQVEHPYGHPYQQEYEMSEQLQSGHLFGPKKVGVPVQNNTEPGEDEILCHPLDPISYYISLPVEDEFGIEKIVIVDNLWFDDEDDDTAVQDIPPKKSSKLRRWARKTFKKLQKTFAACCIHVENDEE